jgi:hypothetical protein
MIFGFNTDVRCGTTVFHVQSEPRYSERLLQTQVFVGGRCIGTRSTSYTSHMCEPGFFEEQLQDMLKGQHRQVVDAAREGRIYELLRETETPSAPPALALEWTNANSAYVSGAVQMHLKVTQAGIASSHARVTSRLGRPGAQASYVQTTTDAQGQATLQMPASVSDLSEAAVVVQATIGGRCVTKKFRLKRA